MKHAKDTFRFLSSFASEQVIAFYESKFGPGIEVCLINGRYQINAGSVNYSYGPLHDAFRRYFTLDPPVKGVDKPVLILGFGGGSIATILRKELELPNPIAGVELDEMMLRAGTEHFEIDKISDLTLIQGDAFEFIQQCKTKFSLIITDIYIDDIIPAVFEQREFLTEARRCLLPGGKLVFNKLLADVNKDSALRALEAIFKDMFPVSRTFLIPVNKKMPNYMLTGSLT